MDKISSSRNITSTERLLLQEKTAKLCKLNLFAAMFPIIMVARPKNITFNIKALKALVWHLSKEPR